MAGPPGPVSSKTSRDVRGTVIRPYGELALELSKENLFMITSQTQTADEHDNKKRALNARAHIVTAKAHQNKTVKIT